MYKLKSKNLTHFLILTAILILFFLIPKNIVIDFFRLPLTVGSSLISDIKAVFTYKFIMNENFELRKQRDSLKKDIVTIEELKAENERLRRLISLDEKSNFDTVAVRVISKDPNNWSRGVIVDKGRRNNIKLGDIAINNLGLVGKVVEVLGDTSKVMLINDPNSSVACIIQRSREEGLVSGTLTGDLILRYLDKDSDAVVGDMILTSSLTKSYPSGILIGEIKQVEVAQRGLSKNCIVIPAVDLKRLEEMLIVINQKE